MKNRVRVGATFSFRGETFHPQMILDLDTFLAEGHGLRDLHPMLARANGIDPYSYQYEILQATPLEFDRPEGLAVAHLHDGRLDLEGLRKARQKEAVTRELLRIAREKMGVDRLDRIPGLKEALLAAWELGRKT